MLAVHAGMVGAAEMAQVDPAQARAWRFDAQRDLPDGEGKELVVRACTRCHDVGGLQAYRGYWGLEQWREMVEGMVKNGAELDAGEAERVARYLTTQYGPGTRR